MALSSYGVLIGTLNDFARDDPNNLGSWYHGKLYVDAPAGRSQCAVDVSTPSNIQVRYCVVQNLNPNRFSVISSVADGWHLLASRFNVWAEGCRRGRQRIAGDRLPV